MDMHMHRKLRFALVATVVGGALSLAGCASGQGSTASSAPSASSPVSTGQGGHGSMDHPMDGGPVPEGMVKAADPKYPVGSEVTLTAGHMHGMKGAKATIVGAYKTYTYAVNYTPAGGEPVRDHKWVVQEEIENPGSKRLADGTEVVLLADHMEGMKGAKATIASSTDETVYVVNYTADGMTMTNHKWVVESEIKPAS